MDLYGIALAAVSKQDNLYLLRITCNSIAVSDIARADSPAFDPRFPTQQELLHKYIDMRTGFRVLEHLTFDRTIDLRDQDAVIDSFIDLMSIFKQVDTLQRVGMAAMRRGPQKAVIFAGGSAASPVDATPILSQLFGGAMSDFWQGVIKQADNPEFYGFGQATLDMAPRSAHEIKEQLLIDLSEGECGLSRPLDSINKFLSLDDYLNSVAGALEQGALDLAEHEKMVADITKGREAALQCMEDIRTHFDKKLQGEKPETTIDAILKPIRATLLPDIVYELEGFAEGIDELYRNYFYKEASEAILQKIHERGSIIPNDHPRAQAFIEACNILASINDNFILDQWGSYGNAISEPEELKEREKVWNEEDLRDIKPFVDAGDLVMIVAGIAEWARESGRIDGKMVKKNPYIFQADLPDGYFAPGSTIPRDNPELSAYDWHPLIRAAYHEGYYEELYTPNQGDKHPLYQNRHYKLAENKRPFFTDPLADSLMDVMGLLLNRFLAASLSPNHAPATVRGNNQNVMARNAYTALQRRNPLWLEEIATCAKMAASLKPVTPLGILKTFQAPETPSKE